MIPAMIFVGIVTYALNRSPTWIQAGFEILKWTFLLLLIGLMFRIDAFYYAYYIINILFWLGVVVPSKIIFHVILFIFTGST